jgi:flagellar protein FlgJ
MNPIASDNHANIGADPKALEALKNRAKSDPKAAAKATAQQFEAIFVQTMLKSMRDANGGIQGALDSDNTKLMTSMLDQQYAQILAKKSIGLAPAIEKALLRQGQATTSPIGDK